MCDHGVRNEGNKNKATSETSFEACFDQVIAPLATRQSRLWEIICGRKTKNQGNFEEVIENKLTSCKPSTPKAKLHMTANQLSRNNIPIIAV